MKNARRWNPWIGGLGVAAIGVLVIALACSPVRADDATKPAAEPAPAASPEEQMAGFTFNQMNGEDVLSELSRLYGIPFRASPAIGAPVSLTSKVQVDLATAMILLEAALADQDYVVRREGDEVRAISRSILSTEVESGLLRPEVKRIILAHSDPKSVAEVVNEVFQTRDVFLILEWAAKTKDPEVMRQMLFDKAGAVKKGLQVKAIAYPALNAVIVKAPREVMEAITTFIKTELDEAEGLLKAERAKAAAEKKRKADAARKAAAAAAAKTTKVKPKAPPAEVERTFELKYVTAQEMAGLCQTFLKFRPTPVPRTNQLIWRTRKYDQFKQLDDLIGILDVPDATSSRLYCVRLKHANAATVQTVLSQLYGFTLARPATEKGAAELEELQMPQRPDVAGPASALLEAAGLGPPEAESPPEPQLAVPFGEVSIVAVIEINALLIRTIPANYAAIKGMIDQIDQPRGQVMMDVFIAEVTLDDTTELGIDFVHSGVSGSGDYSSGMDFGVRPSPSSSMGLTYSLVSDHINVFLRALKTSTRLDVISRPSVTVLDNEEAMVEFGRSVPLIQTSNVNTAGEVISSIVRYQDVTVKLTVTPHINAEAGFIQMKVAQNIDDVSSESFAISEQLAPRILIKRHVQTNVRVFDGQTICLGGFIGDTIDETESKIPLLGDIPWLGELFKSSKRSRLKTELLIFITPHIIRTPEEMLALTNKKRLDSRAMSQTGRDLEDLAVQDKLAVPVHRRPRPDQQPAVKPSSPTTRPAETPTTLPAKSPTTAPAKPPSSAPAKPPPPKAE